MQNSLCSRTFLIIATADALDPFPGGSIRATGLPYQGSSLSARGLSAFDGDGQGESGRGKAHLKLKMRWNIGYMPDETKRIPRLSSLSF